MIEKLTARKEFRFALVGIANTLITYAVYVLLVYFGIHYMVSMGSVYVLGVVMGYIMNRRFTFKSRKKPAAEFGRYIIVYIGAFAAGMILLYCMVDVLGIREYEAGIINICFLAVLSWFGHELFTFKSEKKGDKKYGS